MKSIYLAATLATLTLATACKKKTDDTPAPAMMQLSGDLNATSAIPTNPSPATGTVTGTYDPTSKVLSYTLTFSGLTGPPTIAHFHYGDPKHKGSIFISFANLPTSTSGTITGTTTLTAAQPDSFKLGHVYANIHTDLYKAGEIRANVVVK